MGTANISGIGNGYAQGQAVGNSSDVRKEEEKLSFFAMMSQMTVQPETELFSQNGRDGAGEIHLRRKTQEVGGEYDRYQHHGKNVKAGDAPAAVKNETVTEKLSEYAKNVTEVLKEELGVTDEQIQEAMEALGLALTDLMNPNLLAELVAKITGCENVSELLCDSDFMAVMQTVNELTETFLNELGISLEELTQVMEQISDVTATDTADHPETQMAGASQTDFVATQEEANRNTVVETVDETAEELQTAEQPKMAEESQPKEGVTVVKRQDETTEEPQMEEQSEKTAQTTEQTVFKGGKASENGQMQDGAGEGALFGQNQTEAAPVQGQVSSAEFTSQLDVADIIKQITEFARITVGKAATTMEMQLNPEHLGKLYLEITAKAGAVSAHITTQNELVKEALEAQLVELKETLNQSGVKVDAVEVSVGSHEFERNLEQNAKQQERQAEEQERMAKKTRHINLNELDEMSGLMSEEESLVAQMMAEQGNTVDFTA